jgi:hypothetical protein
MKTPATAAGTPRIKIWQKLALSLLPAGAIVWVMRSGALPILPTRAELALVAPWTIPAYVALWSTMYFLRLSRWYWLLLPVERVPFGTVLRVGAVGLSAIALLPFRIGEFVRPLLIRKPPKLTAWAAWGTVGGERIIDLLGVSVMLLVSLRIAAPLDPLPTHLGTLPIHVDIVPRAAFGFSVFGAVAVLVMGVFYLQRAWARRMTELIVGLVSLRLARWLAGKIEQMAEGLGFLAAPRHAVPYLLTTLVYWLLNAGTFWVLAIGCGLGSIGFWGSTATMGVVALGILVPATPGFFGAFQLAIYAGLAMYLAPDVVTHRGSVYAFLGYALPIGLTTLVGVVALIVQPRALLLLSADAEARLPPEDAS